MFEKPSRQFWMLLGMLLTRQLTLRRTLSCSRVAFGTRFADGLCFARFAWRTNIASFKIGRLTIVWSQLLAHVELRQASRCTRHEAEARQLASAFRALRCPFLHERFGCHCQDVPHVQCYRHQHRQPFPVRLSSRMGEAKVPNLLKTTTR